MERWQAKFEGEIIQWAKTYKGLLDKLSDPTRDKFSGCLLADHNKSIEIFYGELAQ